MSNKYCVIIEGVTNFHPNAWEDNECLRATQQEMEAALHTMRVNNTTTIKPVKKSNNKLIERRKKKQQTNLTANTSLGLEQATIL